MVTGQEAMAEIKKLQEERGCNPHLETVKAAGRMQAGFETLAKEYMNEHKCTLGKAMMACAKLYPVEHAAFIEATNA